MIHKGLLTSVLFICVLMIIEVHARYPDMRVIESNENYMIVEWRPVDFRMIAVSKGQSKWDRIAFEYGETFNETGEPDIPYRTLTIGIPQNGRIRVDILNQQGESFSNIDLAPVPQLYKDESGINGQRYQIDETVYKQDRMLPASLYMIDRPAEFRAVAIQKLHMTPIQYNPTSRTLRFYETIRFKITYERESQETTSRHTVKPRKDFEAIYESVLLNYEQAKHWLTVPAHSRLAKQASLPAGDWYRIAVNQDGLYKINYNTLENAGIDVGNLSVRSIRIFNNGGHQLSYSVNSEYYNPTHTREIPIRVVDQNNNGLFESQDYILFYGKHVNGWFYNPVGNDYEYQQHTYANENYYWLTTQGNNGLRMTEEDLPNIEGAEPVPYFYDRTHFEEDKYNLLASGPDWYGNRFVGKSDSYTLSLPITTNQAMNALPYMRIQLKGGSGVYYSASGHKNYRYYFDILINNQMLLENFSFTRASRLGTNVVINNPQLLVSGDNSVSIQYAGNLDGCIAYLDWFELYYPRDFRLDDGQLRFFTGDVSKPRRYTISNLSADNAHLLLDVSDPAAPRILQPEGDVQNGNLTFDLPTGSKQRQLVLTDLQSAAVKNVTQLERYSGFKDLLSTTRQSDFIIVTHQSFVPYAQQIAELRSELTTTVVSMEDIYFNFNNGVPDPTALRNFIRYAYLNWSAPRPAYVLLFGDGHYDYRNITLSDTMRVPPFEIYSSGEINSRTSDGYFVDVGYSGNDNFLSITQDLAIGRLPVESVLDCERVVNKLKAYNQNRVKDGWQTTLTFVADDSVSTTRSREHEHQNDTEALANLTQLKRFIKKKVYLSMYPSEAGGFGRVKPAANVDLIDYMNQGALIVNYMGHGSPVQWAHESVFNFSRDFNRINNNNKLPLMIAATCDFGKYDDPHEPSFTEALIWEEERGVIGVLAAARLVYAHENYQFNRRFLQQLFDSDIGSKRLGAAMLAAVDGGRNDQKYHLLADPTMRLADPQQKLKITSIEPDTLKALSEVEVRATIDPASAEASSFNGGAIMVVHDAKYKNRNVGSYNTFTMNGPTLFKGEVSVNNGQLKGKFIIPKSIRYVNENSGRITLYAWDNQKNITAMDYNNELLITGSAAKEDDREGPSIDVYFKDQENFTPGDLVAPNPVLIAELEDENGINMTGEVGHNLSLQIDESAPKDISGFFSYKKDSYQEGTIEYPLDKLDRGLHALKLNVFDNLNNPSESEVSFNVASTSGLVIDNVVNYPNPFSHSTTFTFQTNKDQAEVTVKIYTLSGRLIQELHGISTNGFNNSIEWNGVDRDGSRIANGIYLYKIILETPGEKEEKIEKLMIMR